MSWRMFVILFGVASLAACSEPAGPRLPEPEEEEEKEPDPSQGFSMVIEFETRQA